jgi:hypothetical protein
MTAIDYSVDEIVELLKRTNLPTIVVEGSDDVVVYRHLEDRLSSIGADVLPTAGRDKLLQVFERRREFISFAKVVFIADRDTWVHTGIPLDYSSDILIFTDGYSIENDAYRDGQLENLLLNWERDRFHEELSTFLSWYAIALTRHLDNPIEKIDLHPNQIFQGDCPVAFLTLRDGEAFPDGLCQELKDNYAKMLRGKSLINLLVRQTTRPGRRPSHKPLTLLEFVAAKPGQYLLSIEDRVSRCLAGEESG